MAPGSRKRVFSASGIFRISVRRGRGTVDVEGGGGVVKGDGPLQEKNHFIPQKNDKFECILTVFNSH